MPEEELVRLDKLYPDFVFVEDDGPFLHRGQRLTDPQRMSAADRELKAYEYVLEFAARQPVERLRKYSLKDVPVANLYKPIRQDYLRELIHVEGRLARVSSMEPTPDLRDKAKIQKLYEVWVFAKGTNKPVCVVVSELPEGLRTGEDFNLRVAFDAYFFKLWHYESRQPKPGADDPEKKQWHRAPLFLGKTIEIREVIEPEPTFSPGLMMSVIGGLGALGLTGFLISLWFRRGDQSIRASARRRIEEEARFDNIPDQPEQGPPNRLSDAF